MDGHDIGMSDAKRTRSPDAGGKAVGLRWLAARGHAVPTTVVVAPGASVEPAVDLLADHTEVIVRSSSADEDRERQSAAGQYLSVGGLTTPHEVRSAIERVRASGDPATMHVVAQPHLDAVSSGVVFTRNPISGLDERIVEATSGSSTAILAGGAEPDRWISRWGDFVDQPTDTDISADLVRRVIVEAEAIAAEWGGPLDLEWVYDGNRLWWVQLRPITTGRERVYSRRIAREVLPGPIKPLVWSINVPLVNREWIGLFDEAVGPTGLEPFDLAHQFGTYAYFDMGAIGDIFVQLGMPRDALENLLGLPGGDDRPSMRPGLSGMRLLPRMTRFAWRTLRAWDRSEQALGEAQRLLEQHRATDLTSVDLPAYAAQLDADLRAITRTNVVVPLVMNLWSRLLHTSTDLADNETVELSPELQAELDRYAPGSALAALANAEDAQAARRDIIERFGYLSDSGNDLSVPTWAEQPEMLDRFATAATTNGRAVPAGEVLPRNPLKRPVVQWLVDQSTRYRVRREAVSAMYTQMYGLFRPVALEAGRRLVESGAIDEVDDVFYLTRDEAFGAPEDLREVVRERRRQIAEAGDLELPETIIGDDYEPRRRRPPEASVLTGTGTSRGRYTGPARIAHSTADIVRIQPGDVLVVPFSDVGWTPLFATVGAVVAESGGLLSHSSIIARERGIPCVVSVPSACSIPEGTPITVDGDAGDVTIES